IHTSAPLHIYTLSLHDALPIWSIHQIIKIFYGIDGSNLNYFSFIEMLLQPLESGISDMFITSSLVHISQRCFFSFAVLLALFKRSEEHTSELQSRFDLVCRLLL